MPIETLTRYDAWRGIETIGDWFTMARNGRTARCQISTHPLGWELRLIGATTDGFELTQVCRTEQEVFDLGDEWKGKMFAKGWTAPSGT